MKPVHDYECRKCDFKGELKVGRKTCPTCKRRKTLDIIWKPIEIAFSPLGCGWPDANRRAGMDY